MTEITLDAGLSSAAGVMEEATAGPSREGPDAEWELLKGVLLSEMALADMASKARLLQSLSSFLSGVAAAMSFSNDVHALPTWVADSAVFPGHKEVSQVHELVVRELKDHTNFLSEPSWTESKDVDEGADGNPARALNIGIVSQALRCCIRILPLVDIFDRSASLTSTRMLDGMLQQLCHPTKLSHLLGLKASEATQTAPGNQEGPRLEHTEPRRACEPDIVDVDSQHRKELILAILEVFMDELLLRPDFIARLLSSRQEVCRSLAQETISCYVRHTTAALQAAFVHVLSVLQPVAFPQSSPGSSREVFLGCNLSLPAGLIVLEKFSGEDVPLSYIEHIVRFLARTLNDATPLGFGQVEKFSRTRKAGGVDWSYCSREQLSNGDLKGKHLLINVLQPETTLTFASAILEHAILLYIRFALASDTRADGACSVLNKELEGGLLDFYLTKFPPLVDILSESRKVNITDKISGGVDIRSGHLNLSRDDCQFRFSKVGNNQSALLLQAGSGTSGTAGMFKHQGSYSLQRRENVAFQKGDAKETYGLVAALLQLMRCALNCIGRAVCMLTCFPEAVGDQFLNAEAIPFSDAGAGDSDKILRCVGLYLSLCLPSAKTLCPSYEEPRYARAGEDGFDSNRGACAQGPLNVVVGQAIVFFSNILRGEVQRGAPDEVLEEYFHLVESLVALVLALDERKDSGKCAPNYSLVCNSTPADGIHGTSLKVVGHGKCGRCSKDGQLPKACITASYLEEMVLSLKGLVQDLSKQQRSMPEFLLSFMFKQLSKRDALSLVFMGFSSGLHSHLYDQQTAIHRTEGFQSEGLVAEVLQVALSESTRPRSLLVFTVYLVDILQNLVPITTTLSLPEITELISWFETIAHSLTLASQLAACEPRMLARNGEEHVLSFISNLSQGIDRILIEGTAAAHWLSELSKTMTEDSWHKLAGAWNAAGCSTLAEKGFGGMAGIGTGGFGKFNSFLDQVDMLRKAGEELAGSVDPSLLCQLTPLLEKGRTFFAAWSDLLAGRNLLQSQQNLNLSERNEQRPFGSEFQCHVRSMSTEPVRGCEPVDAQQRGSLSTSDLLAGRNLLRSQQSLNPSERNEQRPFGSEFQGHVQSMSTEPVLGCEPVDAQQRGSLPTSDLLAGRNFLQSQQNLNLSERNEQRPFGSEFQFHVQSMSTEPVLDGEPVDAQQRGSLSTSDLLAGGNLFQSHQNLNLSERNEQRPFGSEFQFHVQSMSTEPVLGCEPVDAQQRGSLATSSEIPHGDTVVEDVQEPARTPARESSQTDDQNLPTEKAPCSEEPSLPTGKCVTDSQDEGMQTQSEDGPLFSTAGIPVTSFALRFEKRQTRSATALMMQKVHTQADAVGPEKLQATPEDRKQCSPRTSAIIKRLLENGSPAKKISTSRSAGVSELSPEVENTPGQEGGSCEVMDGDVPASSNSFVDSLIVEDPDKDTFDDLNDFIVPKKGRDYSKWLKKRQKFRRRLYSKNFFRRLHEKKELLHLLDS